MLILFHIFWIGNRSCTKNFWVCSDATSTLRKIQPSRLGIYCLCWVSYFKFIQEIICTNFIYFYVTLNECTNDCDYKKDCDTHHDLISTQYFISFINEKVFCYRCNCHFYRLILLFTSAISNTSRQTYYWRDDIGFGGEWPITI